MAGRRTESEQRFERYLDAHGYSYEYEPDLGSSTRPDYRIERDGTAAICEVKEFHKDPLEKRGSIGALSDHEVYGAVRGAVQHAARQLKPLVGTGLPLVVVVSNPKGVSVFLEVDDVISALYGNPLIQFRLDNDGGFLEEPVMVHGKDGRLRNKHSYISAFLILHRGTLERDWTNERWREMQRAMKEAGTRAGRERVRAEHLAAVQRAEAEGLRPEGEYFNVQVIRTLSNTAVPLPETLFNGSRDQQVILRNVDAAVARNPG